MLILSLLNNPNISQHAIKDALKFISLLDSAIPSPQISAIDDGEINFWWNLPNIRIDLGMYGNNKYSYYARLSNGIEIMADNIPISYPLPSLLLTQLTSSQ